MATYYAFHHPDARTAIFTYPEDAPRADGFVTVSRTGIDLFRPLLTMRLPRKEGSPHLDLEAGVALLKRAVTPPGPIIIHTRFGYLPLLRAVFNITSERLLRLFRMTPNHFEPIINVFVIESTGPDGQPRFIIRNPPGDPDGELLASATTNWQSPRFAEIAVYTHPQHRRQGYGRSVVSALASKLLEQGKTPLYIASGENTPSIELAQSISFADTLVRNTLLEAEPQGKIT
jgi:GNAT superfamily N-acetyltransferase